MLDSACTDVELSSSSSIVCSDEEAMGGEYMRVLDALSSLKDACSMYQRQAPVAMMNKQRPSLLPMPLSSSLFFASPCYRSLSIADGRLALH